MVQWYLHLFSAWDGEIVLTAGQHPLLDRHVKLFLFKWCNKLSETERTYSKSILQGMVRAPRGHIRVRQKFVFERETERERKERERERERRKERKNERKKERKKERKERKRDTQLYK